MDFDFKLYHNILFLGLHPKRNHQKKDVYFKEQILNVKKEYYLYQPLYDNDFEKPLTPKRKYYAALIEFEAIKYLNNIFTELNNAISINEKKYLFNSFCNIISEKFKEIYAQCTKEGYNYMKLLEGIDDSNLEDETFVILFLKTELIRIYLEITERFIEYNTGDILNIEQVYKHFFKEKQPSPSLFSAAEQIKTATPASAHLGKKTDEGFKVVKSDFRGEKKGVFSYDTMIKNPQFFAQFEEQLFSNNFINKDYNFQKDKVKINDFACIYIALFKKGYFHKRKFQPNKEIKLLDIKKFLNFRYHFNLDKQFRTYVNNPTLAAEFISNHYWIENLPPC